MENDMSKTHEYFQKELGLDKKTSEAIKILMDEGLLEPLLVDLRNALEAEEYQNTTSGIKFDPGKEDLIKRGFSPEGRQRNGCKFRKSINFH